MNINNINIKYKIKYKQAKYNTHKYTIEELKKIIQRQERAYHQMKLKSLKQLK